MSKLYRDLNYDTDWVSQPGDPITSPDGKTAVKANNNGTATLSKTSYVGEVRVASGSISGQDYSSGTTHTLSAGQVFKGPFYLAGQSGRNGYYWVLETDPDPYKIEDVDGWYIVTDSVDSSYASIDSTFGIGCSITSFDTAAPILDNMWSGAEVSGEITLSRPGTVSSKNVLVGTTDRLVSSNGDVTVTANNDATVTIRDTLYGNPKVTFPAGYSITDGYYSYSSPSMTELQLYGPVPGPEGTNYMFFVPAQYKDDPYFDPGEHSEWSINYVPGFEGAYLMYCTGPDYSIENWNSTSPELQLSSGSPSGGVPAISRTRSYTTKTVATTDQIPEAQVNADWDASSGVSQILNKPATFPPSEHTHTEIVSQNTRTKVKANNDGTASVISSETTTKSDCLRVTQADGSTGKDIIISFKNTSEELSTWWRTWPSQLDFTVEYDGVVYNAVTVGESDDEDSRKISTDLGWLHDASIIPGEGSGSTWDGVILGFTSPGGIHIIGDGNGETCSTYTYTGPITTDKTVATTDQVPSLPLSIENGGTGSTTAAGARSSLGAASTATATANANGLMSSSDKSKLNGIEAGATKGVNLLAGDAGFTSATAAAFYGDGTIHTTLERGGDFQANITISIQDGTVSQKGVVQLEDSTDSTSTTKAATPNSVKSVKSYVDTKIGDIDSVLDAINGEVI